ncbi:family 43 glycosylhydrolase [Bifidobacterium sp. MA2]|uniref:Family 43 glycosylhydrolase n=1 Tax=Bifidobacterium santillanense TaxID=2809028 RepID=A0ABS5UML1_9BIFI|nr:family 43 glycosylhydrolase [Bifidobacterium santillanense]MBT1172134.1 family 43 glycosylhydrolase [Bifidobacterium santillanense]
MVEEQRVVCNGVPWHDDEGNVVNAHGVCVLEEDGRFYLFGEYKTDDENRFAGFSCYESDDLAHWRFDGLALAPEDGGPMGSKRIGERPKVMRSPKTGKYVMLMHSDDLTYTDPYTAVAVSDAPAGPYEFIGPLEYHGEPIRMWDIGSFQDEDGTGYLLTHEGNIYRLADDYMSAEELVAENIAEGGESPAMFRWGDTYYIMFSNKTSWGSNDNYYLSAPSPAGPWTHRGLFAPEGSRTYDSQCSFILMLRTPDGRVTPIYMGDRWSFPHQVSCATQVWLPLRVTDDGALRLPDEFWDSWDPFTGARREPAGVDESFSFRSKVKGAGVELPFTGTGVALYSDVSPDNAYGRVEIVDGDGDTVISQLVTFYGPTRLHHELRFVSPRLDRGSYRLRVTALDDPTEWFYKSGKRNGCSDTYVDVSGVSVSA